MTTKDDRQHGFTLIEAAAVLAVIAIIATSVAPSLQATMDTRRIDGAATQFVSDLQYARSESVARNERLRLSFYSDAHGSCYVVHSGTRADCKCTGSGPAQCTGDAMQIRTVAWPAERQVSAQINSAAQSMLFDPRQGTVTPAGTVTIAGVRGRSVKHTISATARVRSCSPSAAVPGYRAC